MENDTIIRHLVVLVMVLPDFFRGMGAWRNSTETQLSGHASRSEQEVKNERSSAKDVAPERLRCGTIHRGELDPAVGVCKRCKKNSTSVLSCICKRTREGCDSSSEVGTVHSGRDGEGAVHPRKPKSHRLNVVVRSTPPLTRGGPKWRDNFSEGSDHPVNSNRV